MAGTFSGNEGTPWADPEEKNVLENLKRLHPNRNDRAIIEKVYGQLLDIKSGTNSVLDEIFDGFIYCWIIIESAFRASDKYKFRVKIIWTGRETKQEVQRLYEIPAQYQNLIINGRAVSDEQTLEAFDFQPTGQIVYVFLTKKKVNYAESNIRISDVISPRENVDMADGAVGGNPRETVPARVYDPMDADTDGSSDNTADTPSTSSSGSSKRRGGKKRSQRNRRR
ncbi:uncharacterized protein LOC120340857 [Styela clava]